MQPLLDIRDLSVSYGPNPVLDHVSLSVEQGRVLGVVGESGCGKSTLAKAALGILDRDGAIDGGQVIYDGRDIAHLTEKELAPLRGAGMALVSQNPYATFSPVRTLGAQFVQVLRLHGQMSSSQAYEQACELLRRVELHDPERVLAGYAFELSGGMCQRTSLALAMAQRPRLLLADEPTSALDVTVQAQVVREILKMRDEVGCGILLISHNMGVVFHMADTIAVMYAGRMVERGTTEQVRDNPLHPYTRALLASIPQIGEAKLTGIPGAPPALGEMPDGCRFAPRCREYRWECAGLDLNLRDAGDGHMVACPLALFPAAGATGEKGGAHE